MRRGAVILCGGRSSRMGMPKLALPFGPETMLQRVVRLVSEVAERVVVVAAPGQELPQLDSRVGVVRDRHEGQGPLEGMAVGLAAIESSCDAAFVTSCDVPLLMPSLVERLFTLLGDAAIAVPVDKGFHHPLTAVYRPNVVATIERLLAADRRRPFFLFHEVPTREIPAESLRDVDNDLHSLENINHPADYFAALATAGFAAPPEVASVLDKTG